MSNASKTSNSLGLMPRPQPRFLIDPHLVAGPAKRMRLTAPCGTATTVPGTSLNYHNAATVRPRLPVHPVQRPNDANTAYTLVAAPKAAGNNRGPNFYATQMPVQQQCSSFSGGDQPVYNYWGGSATADYCWPSAAWPAPLGGAQPPPGAAGFWPDPQQQLYQQQQQQQQQMFVQHGVAAYTPIVDVNRAVQEATVDIKGAIGPAGDAASAARPDISTVLTSTRVVSVPLRSVKQSGGDGSLWLHVVAMLHDREQAATGCCERFHLRDPDGSRVQCVFYLQSRAAPQLDTGRWVYCVGRLDRHGVFVCVNVRPANRQDIGQHRRLTQLARKSGADSDTHTNTVRQSN